MVLFPASGGARYARKAAKIIRFARHGCTNRPFFHIVVMQVKRNQHQPVIEQLGTYDPHPNQYNEQLVSLNLERIRYWIAQGADTSRPVQELFGLAGFFPIHPRSYMNAWRNRKVEAEKNVAVEEETPTVQQTVSN